MKISKEELNTVQRYLDRAEHYNVLTQVVAAAFKYMETNPKATYVDALEEACDEWRV